MDSNIYIKKSAKVFDAIVVGSGITGGWAAKELTEKGLKVLMVERGRPVEHRTDYVGEGVQSWKLPFRNDMNHQLVEDQYFI
ncbi:MAG: GMC family oxidoreductase, partial [Moraxellaceae bacterium]